ncbi:MAG: replication-associated recombination protein A [Blastocatellia bacterium]
MKADTTPSLFDEPPAADSAATDSNAPLAERMRPRTLEEFVGQEQIVGAGKLLRRLIAEDKLTSMIFWGPPGTGKTTLARIIAHHTKANFVPFSAVTSGIKEIKQVMADAAALRTKAHRKTVLFVDEIHRFNRAQQDAFLPYVENGTITLIGATTENPSFEINSALLSRMRVFVLEQLNAEQIAAILRHAMQDDERGLGKLRASISNLQFQISNDLLLWLAEQTGGDARNALNTLELAVTSATSEVVTENDLREALQRANAVYDKTGEQHYNLISAFIKSMRNSDTNATLYWLARMIEGGEDPMFIARRIVHHAAEDVGMADPNALVVATAAAHAAHLLGFPEARLSLAEAAVYLARAPKSNRVYAAYEAAAEDARQTQAEPVPLHLRNAPTKLMKGLGYGKDYQYAHDFAEGKAEMECLPERLWGKKYYEEK